MELGCTVPLRASCVRSVSRREVPFEYLRPYCSNTFTVTLPYPFRIFCTAVVHMYLYRGFRTSCNSLLRNALCPCAKFDCGVMVSCETWRQTAYDEDLRWRMVWQREALGYSYSAIASNLNVDKATVLRTTQLFHTLEKLIKNPILLT